MMETLPVLIRSFNAPTKKQQHPHLHVQQSQQSSYYRDLLFDQSDKESFLDTCKASLDLNYAAFSKHVGTKSMLLLASLSNPLGSSGNDAYGYLSTSASSSDYSSSPSPSPSFLSSLHSSSIISSASAMNNISGNGNSNTSTTTTAAEGWRSKLLLDKDIYPLQFYSNSSSSSSSNNSSVNIKFNQQQQHYYIPNINVDQYEWVSPNVKKDIVSLYGGGFNDGTSSQMKPSHLVVLDQLSKTLHLFSLFHNNLNESCNQFTTSETPIDASKIRLKSSLCIISPFAEDAKDHFNNSGSKATISRNIYHDYILHSFSIPFKEIVERVSHVDENAAVNDCQVEILSADDRGNIVLLVQGCTVVSLKIQQMEQYHYLFFIVKRFNLAINDSLLNAMQNITTRHTDIINGSSGHLARYMKQWLFVLDKKTAQIDIWNANGKKRGIIQTRSYMKYNGIDIAKLDDDQQMKVEFIDFSVSFDLMSISIVDSTDRIYMLSIDDYFQQFYQHTILHSLNVVSFANAFKKRLGGFVGSNSSNTVGSQFDETFYDVHSNRENEEEEEEEDDDEDDYDEDDDDEIEIDGPIEQFQFRYKKQYQQFANDRSSVFLYHWYETDVCIESLENSKAEFESTLHWLPKNVVHHPNNGFNITTSSAINAAMSSGQLRSSSSKENLSNITRSMSTVDELASVPELHTLSSSIDNNSNNNNKNPPSTSSNSCHVLSPHSIRTEHIGNQYLLSFSLFVSPRLVVYQKIYYVKNQFKTEYFLYDRIKVMDRCSYLVFSQHQVCLRLIDNSFYVLDHAGMNVILVDQNQQQILNNLIMFEGSESANHVCTLNKWNKRDLKLHALHLGLKYRQLDVVEPALKSLDLDQQLPGSKLLVNTILEHSANAANANVHNETFTNELLHITMNFIGLIIKNRASQVHQNLLLINSTGNNEQEMNNINWTESLAQLQQEHNLSLPLLLNSNSNTLFSNGDAGVSAPESGEADKATPIQDLLHFTMILEALRVFQKKKQDPGVSLATSHDKRYTFSSATASPYRATSVQQRNLQDIDIFSLHSNSLIDMTQSFINAGIDLARWDSMEEMEIIRESLTVTGNISTLISYINWRREQRGILFIGESIDTSKLPQGPHYSQHNYVPLPKFIPSYGPFTLDQVIQISSCFIYQAVSQDQLDNAIKLLTTIGTPIGPNLKQLVYNTSRRTIRTLLLDALASHPLVQDPAFFSNKVDQLLDFCEKLERLYPNYSYHREFSRLSFKWPPFLESKPPLLVQQQQQLQQQFMSQYNSHNLDLYFDDDVKLLCQEVDDVLPDTEHLYGFQIITTGGGASAPIQQSNVYSSGFLRGGPPPQTSHHHHHPHHIVGNVANRVVLYPPTPSKNSASGSAGSDGYSHFTLGWVSQWSEGTKERILIDKQYELGKQSLKSKLIHSISHNQHISLLDLVNQLSISEIGYLRSMILDSSAKGVEDDTDPQHQQQRSLYEWIISSLGVASPFIRDLFLNHLAKHKIFLIEAEKAPVFHLDFNHGADANQILMKRLALNHLLFPESADASMSGSSLFKAHSYPLNTLLPIGNTSDFHKYFIKFCIDNSLYLLLTSYLDSYQLARDHSSRALLDISIDSLTKHPLVQLHLLMRSKRTTNDLIQANIVNTVSLLTADNSNSRHTYTSAEGKDVQVQLEQFFSMLNACMDRYSDRPLLVLGSMMYSPFSVKDLFSEISDRGKKLESKLLLLSIESAYPTIHALLENLQTISSFRSPSSANLSQLATSNKPRDIVSAKQDISLSELLENDSLFHLGHLFGADQASDPTFRVQRSLIPEFASQSFKEGYHDNLDVFYFLEKGRPMKAYQFLLKSLKGDTDNTGTATNGIFKNDQTRNTFGWMLRLFSLKRVYCQQSTSSSVVLLDLCQMQEYSEMIRIDLSMAKRLLSSNGTGSPVSSSSSSNGSPYFSSNLNDSPTFIKKLNSFYKNTSFKNGVASGNNSNIVFDEESMKEIINLFIEIYPTPESLYTSLSSKSFNEPTSNSSIHTIVQKYQGLLSLNNDNNKENNDSDSDMNRFDEGWTILSKFCHIHRIVKITKQLEYLAASNEKWLEFIYQAQVQEFPLHQIKDILLKYGNDSSGIRSHLLLVIEQLSDQRKRQYISADQQSSNTSTTLLDTSLCFYPIEESKLNHDIIGYMLSAFRSNSPRNYLLYNTIKDKRPLLAVIADCIDNSNNNSNSSLSSSSSATSPIQSKFSNTIECLVTWLCVSSDNLLEYLETGVDNPINIGSSTSSSVEDSFDFDLDALDISLDHHIVPNITKYSFTHLIKSIKFIITNRKTFVLLQGFKIFLPNSILMNFLLFINDFHQYRFEDAQISLMDFIKDLEGYQPAVGTIDHYCFHSKQLVKEFCIDICEALLDIYSSYEKEHFLRILHRSNLSSIFSTLHSTYNLFKRTMLEDKNIRMDPALIVHHLIEKGLFKEARVYSVENNLDVDIITVAEVEALVSHYKHGCLWDIEQERINLWKKSQQYFTQHQCNPNVAGQFFYTRGNNILPSREKVFLLSTSVEWIEKCANHDEGFVQDIKKQILLISVTLSLENDEAALQASLVSQSGEFDSFSPSSSPPRGGMARGKNINSGGLLSNNNLVNYFSTTSYPSPSSSLSSSPVDFDSPLKDMTRKLAQSSTASSSPTTGSNYLQNHPISSLLNSSTGFATPNGSSSLTTSGAISPIKSLTLEPKGLDNVLAKLLNSGNYLQAEQIAQQFNYSSLEYEVITSMIKIVNRSISPNPKKFPSNIVMELMNNFQTVKWIQSIDSTAGYDSTSDNILTALEKLASLVVLTKHAARNIITKYRVAEKLSMTFSELESNNPYEVFNQLISQGGKDCFRLVKSFINTKHLDLSIVNNQLAELFSKTIITNFENTNGSGNNANMNQLSLSLDDSPKKQPPHRGGLLSSSNSSSSLANAIDPNWSSEDFHEYIRIGKDPFSFGMKLIEASGIDFDSFYSIESSPNIFGQNNNNNSSSSTKPLPSYTSSNSNNITMEAETELFVRAHFCFVVACSVDGTILVLNLVKSRINQYAEAGKYKLLVRLITGMQSYNELQAILEILLQHDRFELLLRKKIHQHEDQNGLKLALHSFLLKKQPLYQEKMEMLFLRFNMYREIANSHEQKARTKLESLSKLAPSFNLNKDLLVIMKDFLDAADNYSKERSQRTAQTCISMGSLMALQMRYPEPKIINLKQAEAKQAMLSRSNFKESLIIANAYDINAYSEWINTLFNQVIINGNFNYMNEYISFFSYSNTVFIDLVKRYKTDPKGGKSQNIKLLLLNIISDKSIRYELARELGFDDVMAKSR
ncbi:hypothetical protein CYY_006140 [Polysphondylium violaceum]|uniref:Spatacsin C-terminal domain-containing protein n=1 Tax=Polysphondylium violaceum TaxID=133409 RepID=A0A8J4PR02_9MYCE|nr:hypothetical protein CYY_006140 [Polysphondylium violaceum]